MADATASLGIQVTTQGVDQASQQLDKLDKSAKNVAQSSRDLGTAQQQSVSAVKNVVTAQAELTTRTTATSSAMNFLRGVFGGASEEMSRARAVHGLFAAAAGQTTEAITRTASATHGLRGAMETLRPVLAGAGIQLGGFGGLLGAARAGIGALAIAIAGGLAASIEKTNESTESLRRRFTAIGGTTKQFEELKQIARDTGASLSDLTAVQQTLNRTLEQGQAGKWVGDLSQINQNSTLATKSLAELSKAAGADFGKVSEAIKSVVAGGKLTKDIFLQIVSANEAVGLAIAKAFHQPSIKAMADDLERSPRAARELTQALQTIGPITADAADKTKSLSAAWGQVKQGISDVSAALGGTFVSTTISAFGQFLSWIAKGITALGQLQSKILSIRFPPGSQVGSLGKVADIVAAAQGKPSFQQGDNSGSSLFDSGSNAGGTAFGPPPGSVTAPSSGGFVEPPNSVTGQQFMGEEFVGAFASGGSFMVGGSGSTDSRRISMAVTPGERVTVTPPATNSTPVGGVGGSKIIQNFVFPNASPQSFAQSMSQVRRAARQVLA